MTFNPYQQSFENSHLNEYSEQDYSQNEVEANQEIKYEIVEKDE